MTKTDRLNSLERKAIKNEEAAGAARWDQAKEIVRRLGNETEREIAVSWVNGRTGKPYSHKTVEQFAGAWRQFGRVPAQNRPPFWKAVEEAEGRSTTRIERNEAQAPRSAETARKLAENLAKAEIDVQRAFADELIKQPSTESSLRHLADPPPRKPREPKPVERRLGEAAFSLWEIGEALLDEVPTPEERLRMLAIAEKAQRLAVGIVHLLDTGELEDEFRKLVDEVGAQS